MCTTHVPGTEKAVTVLGSLELKLKRAVDAHGLGTEIRLSEGAASALTH